MCKRKACSNDAMQDAMDAVLEHVAKKYKRTHTHELGENLCIAHVSEWGRGLFVKRTAAAIKRGSIIAGYGGRYTDVVHDVCPHEMSHAVTLSHGTSYADGRFFDGKIAFAGSVANTASGTEKNNAKLCTVHGKEAMCVVLRATRDIEPGKQILCQYKMYPDGERQRIDCKKTVDELVEGHSALKLQRIWAHDVHGVEPRIVSHVCMHGSNEEEHCACHTHRARSVKWIRIRKATARSERDAGEGCFVHVPTLLKWDNHGRDDIIVLSACNTNFVADKIGRSELCKWYNVRMGNGKYIAPRIKAHMPAMFYANELHPEAGKGVVSDDALCDQGILKAVLEHVDGVPCLKVNLADAKEYVARSGKEWAEMRFVYDTIGHTFGGRRTQAGVIVKAETRAVRGGKRLPRRMRRGHGCARDKMGQVANQEIDYIDGHGHAQTIVRAVTTKHFLHQRVGMFLTCNSFATMLRGNRVVGKTFAEVVKSACVVVGFVGDKLVAHTKNDKVVSNEFVCQVAFVTAHKKIDLSAFDV